MRKNKAMSNAEIEATVAGCGGCTMVILIYLIGFSIGAFALNYTVDTWLQIAGKLEDFPLAVCFLLCLVPDIGQLSLVAAVITFIASYFV